MRNIATVSDLQSRGSALVKQAVAEGLVPISKNGRTEVFLISKGKLAGILETMELQDNAELMKLVAADKAGKVQFKEVPDEL